MYKEQQVAEKTLTAIIYSSNKFKDFVLTSHLFLKSLSVLIKFYFLGRIALEGENFSDLDLTNLLWFGQIEKCWHCASPGKRSLS